MHASEDVDKDCELTKKVRLNFAHAVRILPQLMVEATKCERKKGNWLVTRFHLDAHRDGERKTPFLRTFCLATAC